MHMHRLLKVLVRRLEIMRRQTMANTFFLLMIFSRDFERTLEKKKWSEKGPKLQHIMKPTLEEKSVMHREGALLLCLQQINLPESQESKEFLLGLQQRKET